MLLKMFFRFLDNLETIWRNSSLIVAAVALPSKIIALMRQYYLKLSKTKLTEIKRVRSAERQ